MNNFYKYNYNIPDKFPLGHYKLPFDPNKPQILIGMDSGVSHLAFSETSIIKENGHIRDIKIENLYYFENEIRSIPTQDDRYFYIAEQYYNLFSKKQVKRLGCEIIALNDSPNTNLQSLLRAQKVTDILTFLCRCLSHPYSAIPPKVIKYCIKKNGNASKGEMQEAIYKITGEQYPIFLENDHLTDAYAIALYLAIDLIKTDCTNFNLPIPEKYAFMDWNFKGCRVA